MISGGLVYHRLQALVFLLLGEKILETFQDLLSEKQKSDGKNVGKNPIFANLIFACTMILLVYFALRKNYV